MGVICMISISATILSVLGQKGMSQVDLAKLCQCSPQALSNKIRRDNWYYYDVVKILSILDCDIYVRSDNVTHKLN